MGFQRPRIFTGCDCIGHLIGEYEEVTIKV